MGTKGGAFTDARESHVGIITQAQHGTLFLDEVESMSARGHWFRLIPNAWDGEDFCQG
jgi:transcriptional regulator with AAA-type ATPase domain